MAFPSMQPDISSTQKLLILPALMYLSSLSQISFASLYKPRVVEISTAIVDASTTPDGQQAISYSVDSPSKHAACIIDTLDPNFSDSMGNEPFYCPPSQRMGSDDKPCPNRQACCPCLFGTYQAKDNICDTCVKHTPCKMFKRQGTATNDSICLDPADAPDTGQVPVVVDTGQVPTDFSPLSSCKHSPCHNGGSCGYTINGIIKCFCTDGWMGLLCHTDINECHPGDVCQNGGNCNNFPGGFDCFCTPDWKGQYCEVKEASNLSLWPYLFSVVCVVLFILLLVIVIMYLRKKYKTQSSNHDDSYGGIPMNEPRRESNLDEQS